MIIIEVVWLRQFADKIERKHHVSQAEVAPHRSVGVSLTIEHEAVLDLFAVAVSRNRREGQRLVVLRHPLAAATDDASVALVGPFDGSRVDRRLGIRRRRLRAVDLQLREAQGVVFGVVLSVRLRGEL